MERGTSWLTVDEYAALMGMHPVAVRRLCKRGSVAAEKQGRVWRIPYTPPHDAEAERIAAEAVEAAMRPCIAVVDAAIEALEGMRRDLSAARQEVAA